MKKGKSREVIQKTNLTNVLKCWRLSESYTAQNAAFEIGIKAAALNRIELGHKIDADTLVQIVNWLMDIPF
jgi:hypothetical protein